MTIFEKYPDKVLFNFSFVFKNENKNYFKSFFLNYLKF